MITYYNYHRITKENDKQKYDVIVESLLNPMIESMVNNEKVDYKNVSLASYAYNLLKTSGMIDEEINTLKTKLMN